MAVARLFQLLLRVARQETRRRAVALRLTGPEVDDLADQAAADALLAILGKVDDFRGESRFTTWAAKFVIFEVAGKVNRHHWRHGEVAFDDRDWDQLPARFGMQPENEAEWRDLVVAVRIAVDTEFTGRQRAVFVAVVVRGRSIDVVAAEMGSNRNAVYKVMFDARQKLRSVLTAQGYLAQPQPDPEPPGEPQ